MQGELSKKRGLKLRIISPMNLTRKILKKGKIAVQSKAETLEAITKYYTAAEKGYWGLLAGRCHYGYASQRYSERFDMHSAQLEMEHKLGETLGLPAGSRVLDAGCGWGMVARYFSR